MLFIAVLVFLVLGGILIKWQLEERERQERKARLAKYRIKQQQKTSINTAEIFRVKNVIFINPRKMRSKAINSSDDKLHS